MISTHKFRGGQWDVFENDNKTVIRFIALTEKPVRGSFLIDDEIHLYEMPESAPKASANSLYNPLIIEISFLRPDIETLRASWDHTNFIRDNPELGILNLQPPTDESILNQAYVDKMEQICCFLSVVTQFLVCRPQLDYSWLKIDQSNDSAYGLSGYKWVGFYDLPKKPQQNFLPSIPLVDSIIYDSGFFLPCDVFCLPDLFSQIFKAYRKLNSTQSSYFLPACSLFAKSIQTAEISPSLSYLGIISSLETLVEYEKSILNSSSPRCAECGHLTRNISLLFSKFLCAYASEFDSIVDKEKYSKMVYGMRSRIGHTEQLLTKDQLNIPYSRPNHFTDSRDLNKLHLVARSCIFNWLLYDDPNSLVEWHESNAIFNH